MHSLKLVLLGVLGFGLASSAQAVFFYSTGSSTYNTGVPGAVDGLNADDAWNLQGQFGNFLGTPISDQYFITAKHIGGSIGQSITFGAGANVGSYVTASFTDSPTTDLRIWKISGTFAQFAERYTASDEVGKNLIVFGRGTQRGAQYIGPLGPTDGRGWAWGAADQVKRWGINTVTGTQNSGSLLSANFDSIGGNEAMLSVGDSGGGVFIQDGGVWKLAGINYAVSGAYYSNTGVTGSGVQAGIFNQSGLYSSNANSGFGFALPGPGAFYPTRISQEETWIGSVVPEPGACGLLLLGGAFLLGFRRLRGSLPLRGIS